MFFSLHRSSLSSYYYNLKGSSPITIANRATLSLLCSVLHFVLNLCTLQFLFFFLVFGVEGLPHITYFSNFLVQGLLSFSQAKQITCPCLQLPGMLSSGSRTSSPFTCFPCLFTALYYSEKSMLFSYLSYSQEGWVQQIWGGLQVF